MQLKLRHLLLFVVACTLLIYAQTPGGALLALGILMQLALLIHGLELTRKSQVGAFKLFLASIPLFLFWGGIHSFVVIYLSESQHTYFLMALAITLVLSFLLGFQVVFSYRFLQSNNFELIASLQDALNNIKTRKTDFLKISLLLFIFSFIPWLSADWKLVFMVAVVHLHLNQSQLKKALSSF